MAYRIDELLEELGGHLEGVLPEGSDNQANLDLPSGRILTVLTNEAFERLWADAQSWRALRMRGIETMSPAEFERLMGTEKKIQ